MALLGAAIMHTRCGMLWSPMHTWGHHAAPHHNTLCPSYPSNATHSPKLKRKKKSKQTHTKWRAWLPSQLILAIIVPHDVVKAELILNKSLPLPPVPWGARLDRSHSATDLCHPLIPLHHRGAARAQH